MNDEQLMRLEALRLAMSVGGGVDDADDLLKRAEKIYQWLARGEPAAP